jgi:hypothetical protein
MNNLLASIMTKISGSAFSSDVGGRVYLDAVPASEMPATFPYCVFFIVSDVPEDCFAKDGESIMMQFSLFSASSGAAEITTMYADLKALLDDCSFTITSNVLNWFRRVSLTTMTEDITTVEGTTKVKHWSQEYEITTQKI